MTKQFKELAAFKEKKERLEQLTVDLEVQITEKTTQKNALLREREDLLIAEAIGDGKLADAKRIAQLEKDAAAIDTELKSLQVRLDTVKECRSEALKPLLEPMVKGYGRERERLDKAASEKMTEARKLLCEYMLKLAEIGTLHEEMGAIKGEVDSLGVLADPDFKSKRRTGWTAFSSLQLFDDNSGMQRGIRERDQTAAMESGILPPFVKLYKVSGELADTHNAANARIREIQKGAE